MKPNNLLPQQVAVALTYGKGQGGKSQGGAPQVVAKGRGMMAQAIIERAKQNNVYVHESEDLVGLLMQVELDQEIPPQLYLAVAELLAWLYKLEHAETPAILPPARR
ncbi:MAG: EscU/YscU/HrcU family type III secretion system export apparatus switch protein [Sulfuricellaceae bacterium]|jgi:flagellar biosynthesis protein